MIFEGFMSELFKSAAAVEPWAEADIQETVKKLKRLHKQYAIPEGGAVKAYEHAARTQAASPKAKPWLRLSRILRRSFPIAR